MAYSTVFSTAFPPRRSPRHSPQRSPQRSPQQSPRHSPQRSLLGILHGVFSTAKTSLLSTSYAHRIYRRRKTYMYKVSTETDHFYRILEISILFCVSCVILFIAVASLFAVRTPFARVTKCQRHFCINKASEMSTSFSTVTSPESSVHLVRLRQYNSYYPVSSFSQQ